MSAESTCEGLDGLVEAFVAHLQRRQKAPATIERWRPELRRLQTWAGGCELAELTAARLELEYLPAWEADFRARNGRGPSPNTVRVAVQALSSLFAFASRYDLLVDGEGRLLPNPALRLEPPTVRPKAELDWLAPEQDRTVRCCRMSERERIAVLLLRWSGLRVSEATGLRNSDLDLASDTLHVRVSKTEAGCRPIPILPELKPEIERWLRTTKCQGVHRPERPFLVTRTGRPWAPQFVQGLVARVGERAGLPTRLTPHCLRRSYGSYLLNAGVRIEVVSRLLGHSSTVVTQRYYARLQDETVRAELLAALRQTAEETR
jgi:integrase